MIPVTQTILHDPANGVHGNCMSAVLASLLHYPVELIPVWTNPATWVQDMNAWLRPFGLAYLNFGRDNLTRALADFGICGLHHEVSGPSPRFADSNHACVGLDGALVFDPHPSRGGLGEEAHAGVFIALEPWRMLK